MTADKKFFEDNSQKISDLMKQYGRRSILLSVFRFVVFICGIASIVIAVAAKLPVFFILFGVFMIAFIVLCIVHGKVSAELNYYEALGIVNSKYVARINGDFDSLFSIVLNGLKRRDEREDAVRYASGSEFYTDDHDYCTDLDLFGKKSLFSRLNVSETSF